MDTKITKKRFLSMLSYDWLKIVALAVAACLVWSIILTTTGTGIANSQEFIIFNHTTNATLSNEFYNLLTGSVGNVFSYEVLETNAVDVASMPEQEGTFYQSYMGAEMGDLLFLHYDINEEDSKAQQFISGYTPYVQPVDKYLAEVKAYVSQYYPEGDYRNGELNKQNVEAAFRLRIQTKKDKRFKKQSQIEAGLADEYARIEKYADALAYFEDCLEDGYVRYEQATVAYSETESFTENYFLNLCPDNISKMSNLKTYLSYRVGEDNLVTAQDMSVAFLKTDRSEYEYRGELLLFVNALIAASKTA